MTRHDRIRNERMKATTKVREISKKVQDRRLQWYGHVMRSEEKILNSQGGPEHGSRREKEER